MDGKKFSNPINVDIVKKYYAWGNKEKWLAKVENPKRRLWQEKQKEKKVQAKTRKGSLDQKEKGQVENPKGWLDYGKEVPRLKTWKGNLEQWKLTGARKERNFFQNQKFH